LTSKIIAERAKFTACPFVCRLGGRFIAQNAKRIAREDGSELSASIGRFSIKYTLIVVAQLNLAIYGFLTRKDHNLILPARLGTVCDCVHNPL
jgi:hypothetical protein